MMALESKRIELARNLATAAHQNQRYQELLPYMYHIDQCVKIGIGYGLSEDIICALYLHDTIEDQILSYSKIKKYLGYEVAEYVYAVSDLDGRTRKEKKESTYKRIANCPAGVGAALVKLVDRIANVKFSKDYGEKIEMYQLEQKDFEEKALTPYLDNVNVIMLLSEINTLLNN